MANFAEDILEAANGEPILAIAVSSTKRNNYRGGESAEPHSLGAAPVSWDVAKLVLDYEYDSGYGMNDSHDIWAWTATKVLFVWEYDGSTSIASVPRGPGDFIKWHGEADW